MKVDSFSHAVKLTQLSKQICGETLSALEYMDKASMRHVLKHFKLKAPFKETDEPSTSLLQGQGYMLVEVAGVNAEHDKAKLMTLLETSLQDGHAENVILPASKTQAESIWKLRESCASALTDGGYICYKYDLSLPLAKFNLVMEVTRQRLKDYGFSEEFSEGNVELVCWGHLGDGNLHLNVISRQVDSDLEACLEPWLFQWVIEQGGSISAEHGVGRCKRDLLIQVHSPHVLAMMRHVKGIMDPKGILNPNKMIPKTH